MARFATLDAWLEWQQTLSPKEIVLGLERVRTVGERLGLLRPQCPVITVAGTNGKGSVVALLEAMLGAEGYRVGAYTSPHLLRYNERVRIAGAEVGDAVLCEAFARIDAARDEIPLTYFEFGTLAALYAFADADVEVMLLEVGLGGRLDAVNVIDPDVAVVTSIDLDHADWLGDDREVIGREKAGIMRAARPVICGDRQPPASVLDHAYSLGADLHLLGRDFDAERRGAGMRWSGGGCVRDLPLPALYGRFQIDNAATALAALNVLTNRLPVSEKARTEGLRTVRVAGRFQRLPGTPPVYCDVAHNPQAARALASILRDVAVPGSTLAVFSALCDKDIEAIAAELDTVVAHWFVAGLDTPRGLDAQALAARMTSCQTPLTLHVDVAAALSAARAAASEDDRIVVCGSFLTVAAALAASL
jgi:dihydrofolate synthase / folylpolyglutamate synthase